MNKKKDLFIETKLKLVLKLLGTHFKLNTLICLGLKCVLYKCPYFIKFVSNRLNKNII